MPSMVLFLAQNDIHELGHVGNSHLAVAVVDLRKSFEDHVDVVDIGQIGCSQTDSG